MKSLLLFFLAAIEIVSAKPLSYLLNDTHVKQFEEFVKKYNKHYINEEEKLVRYGMFLKNFDFMDHLNSRSTNAIFGITVFADRTIIESEVYKGYNKDKVTLRTADCKIITEVGDFKTDVQFDWRDKNVVSPVKNQGACGSCWAFSAIGNLESVNAIKTGKIQDLSEQQLVDCEEYSSGCSGGWPHTALSYLVSRGAQLEKDYPYTATDNDCKYDPSKVVVRPTDCVALNVSEDGFAQKLQQMAPLSIAVDANILLYYVSGIIDNFNCHGVEIDHAVVLVGFGEENGVKYWTVRNSWGENWGEKGYFRMQRGVDCLHITKYYPQSAIL